MQKGVKIYQWWMKYERKKDLKKRSPRQTSQSSYPQREGVAGKVDSEEPSENPSLSAGNESTDVDKVSGSSESGEQRRTGSERSESDTTSGSSEGLKSEEKQWSREQGQDGGGSEEESTTSGSSESGDVEGFGEESKDKEGGDDNKERDKHTFNAVESFEVVSKKVLVSKLKDAFYRFIEKIAEEETKLEDPSGYDKYSVKKLMLRRYTGKSLKDTKVSRVRDRVVVIVDNSGSMEWWLSNVLLISHLALSRKDIEFYIAPNGSIQYMVVNGKKVEVNEPPSFVNRTIIYIGDYDGANTPIELSWRNRVYWFCNERRYRRFESHSWVNYSEEDFMGSFFRVWSLSDFEKALRMAIPFRRGIYDFHANSEFEDDRSDESDYDDE